MLNRWSDDDAARAPELDGLLYISHLVGQDSSLVLWGGGNTSVKRQETTPLDGETLVLRVKGSGSDLKSVQLRDFPGLRVAQVQRLRKRTVLDDEEMLAVLALCSVEPGSTRPSIETLLHAFLPAKYVVHTHADAILSLTNTPRGRDWADSAFGREACYVPYVRPGFALAVAIDEALAAQPGARYIVMEKHGLTTWGETPREAYEATIEVCTRAEEFVASHVQSDRPFGGKRVAPLAPDERRRVYAALTPALRALTTAPLEGSGGRRLHRVMRFDDGADVLEFVGSEKAETLAPVGPATPDHMVHTKLRPLFVPWARPDAGAEGVAILERAWERFAEEYRAYVDAGGRSGGLQEAAGGRVSAELLAEAAAPRPRVVLLPGLGMVTIGKDARAAYITADMYRHAIAVMRAAESLDGYASLERSDAFDIEFWPMELYKLTLAPPDGELARRVALVTGAGSGIGRAIALRFAAAGAHVLVTDLDEAAAQEVATSIVKRHGMARARACSLDVADETAVAEAFETAVVEYGGLDFVVSNAGIGPCATLAETETSVWRQSLDVNATGHFFVARAALRLFERQGGGGAMVFVATKNTLAPGASFGAYSAAKAAELQVARVAAIEGGPLGVRVNIVNPDAVFEGSAFWSAELREGRAAQYGIDATDLPDFYRKRNLLGVPIRGEDVAEAALFLVSDRSAKTTGCIITVDGGVREAFPR
jgi:rhamnulose-1-phosphate aldolase/alcohol dehydrogenase